MRNEKGKVRMIEKINEKYTLRVVRNANVLKFLSRPGRIQKLIEKKRFQAIFNYCHR